MSNAGKLAIVTGTSAGIGHALVPILLERGWRVIGVSRRQASFDHVAYRHLSLDLADLDAVASAFERDVAPLLRDASIARVGLVNNAALIGPLRTVDATDAREMLATYAVNVVAPEWLTGFVARHAPRASALRVVNVSSGAANRPTAGLGTYCSTKAALRMASMNAAADFASEPLRSRMTTDAAVLSYSPGTVDTPMQVVARSQSAAQFPAVVMFQGFHDRGALVPAEQPAGEIADFLDSSGVPAFAERRLGE
ncbi:MAG TPA: SDR family NAD(P)-dependent oxidoreductase [Gemmatimonadaceae bacterium]|nr:SDR family NAD(P)-dependent oxidoreductase [Gemmatimonadaceae bacterium]